MRIGFDAKRAFFNRSGLGNYSRDVVRILKQNYPENEYLLYTPSTKNSIEFSGKKNLRTVSPEYAKLKLQQAFWRSYKLTNQVEKDEVDIYHGLSNELPKRNRTSNFKTIVTIHDLIFLRHPEWYPVIDRWIYNKKFQYSSQIADGIIAISQQTRNDLVQFYNVDEKKIKIIHQGCNNVFKNSLTDTEKQKIKEKWGLPDEYILYVGTIEERKNLLSIVKSIHQGNIDIPLVVVGRKTDYYKKVQAYIDGHSLKHIYFLEEVSVSELPGIYQMADIFIYPSIFEGFGIPILEALYSRIPVITSQGGCFSEAGGESSKYVNPLDIEEIINAIKSILTDSRLKEEMVENGYEHAMKFSDENVAENIMLFYKSILDD
jgi:glycosyltransferase involved in cell wall biosynthesis